MELAAKIDYRRLDGALHGLLWRLDPAFAQMGSSKVMDPAPGKKRESRLAELRSKSYAMKRSFTHAPVSRHSSKPDNLST
ncbi:hypothetical protein HIM_00604 [Hirsutella minnesotensis 3608]|nr:hypothetical protein HIM_00604 [Hirsutella minnesotensis 3608]